MAENKQMVIIQTSFTAWHGGHDQSMNIVDGYPVTYWTIKRAAENIPKAEIHVVLPEYDKENLKEIEAFIPPHVTCYCGFSESPLDRILHVAQELSDDEYLIRIDGIHMLFDYMTCLQMLDRAKSIKLDCLKLPDDFPPQFSCDIYRVGALRDVKGKLKLPEEAAYCVHPKFYLFAHKERYKCEFAQPPTYSDAYLKECRELCKSIYDEPRLDVQEEKRIWTGDQMSFHYEVAGRYLDPTMAVLDVGCGEGFGCRMLAPKVRTICGIDADDGSIRNARKKTADAAVTFACEDATRMSFADSSFDAVTCMELLEHLLPPDLLLREIKRVVRRDGIVVFSTPQNRIGHIPFNFHHLREYSLEEVTRLCGEYFQVLSVVGIKAGRIVIPEDPYGANTIIICKNAF